jgi:hypothetical protein
MADQRDTSQIIVVTPAKGLRRLPWCQVEELDRKIDAVCEAGHGSVEVEIERGKPLFISHTISERLSPMRAEGG